MSTGWPMVELREVIREEHEQVKSFDGDGLPVLGVTNENGVTQTGVEASDDKSKYLRLRPGRFVYNPYRINVGSIGLSSDSQDGICSPAYVIFAPSERIYARYLWFFLKSARGNQLINFYGNRGSVRSALRFIDLCKIEIPLPALSEQRGLLARVEEISAQIEQAKALRRQAIEEAKALGKFRLSTFVGREAVYRPLHELCSQITDGEHATPPRIDERQVPLVTAKNVRDGHLDMSFTDFVSQETAERCWKRCHPKDGDVLMVCVGATTGRVCRLADPPDMVIVRSVAMLRCARETLDPQYLEYALESQEVQNQIWHLVKQAAQPCLYLNRMGSLSVPVPSLLDQRRVVCELDALQTEVDRLKRLQAETATELDVLLPSILDRAFKGEL